VAPVVDMAGATMSEYDGVRFLHLDSIWIQGAMRIAKPEHLELEYIQRMMTWMLWRPTEALAEGHAVQLGLGAGAITRFTHKTLGMRTTVVEINPTVIRACRLWFRLGADDALLRIVESDANAWLRKPTQAGSVNVLCVDLYDQEAAGPVLDDEAFYSACRNALAEGGLMTVNLFGRASSFERSAGRIARAFGAGQVWRVQPTKEGNAVVVAGRGVAWPEREVLKARAAEIEARYRLPARKWLRMVQPLALDGLPE
jgi:spermidine synthase